MYKFPNEDIMDINNTNNNEPPIASDEHEPNQVVRGVDGNIIEDADEADIFSLLIECGFHGDMNSPAVAFNMVARFLRAANCVSADTFRVNWLQPLPAQQTAVQVTHAVVAHSPNLRFTQDRHDLQNIPTKATVVAYDNAIAFATPYNNCTLTMPSLRQLRTGATVVRLAQKIP